MLSGFFVKLKDHEIPVSIKEWPACWGV